MFDPSCDYQNLSLTSVLSSQNQTFGDFPDLITDFADHYSPVGQEIPYLQEFQQILQNFAQSSTADEILGEAFGVNYNQENADNLLNYLAQGNFNGTPEIKVIDSDILGSANGAYSAQLNTIFLSDEFVNNNDSEAVVDVVLEEFGHFIDSQINIGDSAGDEGDIFARLVQGQSIDSAELALLQQEDDSALINYNGQTLLVEQDNTLTTALNIGTLSGNRSFAGWVGSTDTNDYYRFSVGTTSNFNLNLTGLSADADVQLLNSSGALIQSSVLGGSSSESITRQLSAGTYFARVYRYSGNTNYNLSLSTNAIAIPLDLAGNTLSNARNIGTLTGTQSFSDWVGSADTNDYYRFSVGTTSNFNLNLTGLSADADVQLLNSSGNVIQSSALGGSSSESITRQLSAGTYFARVYRYRGDTNYNLSLNATAIPLDSAGNTLSSARDVGTLTGTQSFSDWVGSGDTNDYYRFSLDTTSNFNLNLTGLNADADVQLLNSSGALIQSSALAGRSSESITRELSAGTYFARVYRYSGDTNYNLSLTTTPVLPTITITASDPSAAEVINGQTQNQGVFTFTRTGNLTSALTAYYSIGGTATDGSDYSGLTGTVTFEAGSATALLNLNVIDDSTDEGNETVVLTLNANSAYTVGTTNSATVIIADNESNNSDWYSTNLLDAGLISLTRSLASDGNLSRNDMLSIFRDAQDGSTIDANEQLDLRTLVNNSSRFTMADYVRYLSAQVANGTATNMSASQFESNLVGRWFLGTVAPTGIFNNYNLTHTAVQGSLFGSSGQARIGDIDQGYFGDCAFLAALGATFGRQSNDSGNQSSSVINSMIIDNGDNTYTMRFYSNGSAEYVTVDRRLAMYNGSIIGASTTNALWVPLVERAYAQWREWREGQPGYNLIGNGDNLVNPLSYVTGRTVNEYSTSNLTFSQLQTALNNGQAVETGRLGSNTTYIVGGHAYSVTNAYINSGGQQRVVVRNPWGVDGLSSSDNAYDGFIDLSFDEFRSNFNFGVAIA